MDVLYRTINSQPDGWHVESVDDKDHVEVRVFATRSQALDWCCDQEAIPQPDFAEGGRVLAPVLDGDDDEDG